MGEINAAAALFVTMFEIKKVAKYTAPIKPASPMPIPVPTFTKNLATASATPEFTSAKPIPNAAAIVM
jgi:hypothetical protein